MRTEEVEREAGSRDEMETGLNPLFLLFFALRFCGKEEEGQVLVLVVEKTTNTIVPTTTRTKGVIVCIYVLLYIYIYSFQSGQMRLSR